MECSKVKFDTKKDAVTALNYIQKFGKKHKYRKECRFYYCYSCKSWHLTSKEKVVEE